MIQDIYVMGGQMLAEHLKISEPSKKAMPISKHAPAAPASISTGVITRISARSILPPER